MAGDEEWIRLPLYNQVLENDRGNYDFTAVYSGQYLQTGIGAPSPIANILVAYGNSHTLQVATGNAKTDFVFNDPKSRSEHRCAYAVKLVLAQGVWTSRKDYESVKVFKRLPLSSLEQDTRVQMMYEMFELEEWDQLMSGFRERPSRVDKGCALTNRNLGKSVCDLVLIHSLFHHGFLLKDL